MWVGCIGFIGKNEWFMSFIDLQSSSCVCWNLLSAGYTYSCMHDNNGNTITSWHFTNQCFRIAADRRMLLLFISELLLHLSLSLFWSASLLASHLSQSVISTGLLSTAPRTPKPHSSGDVQEAMNQEFLLRLGLEIDSGTFLSAVHWEHVAFPADFPLPVQPWGDGYCGSDLMSHIYWTAGSEACRGTVWHAADVFSTFIFSLRLKASHVGGQPSPSPLSLVIQHVLYG